MRRATQKSVPQENRHIRRSHQKRITRSVAAPWGCECCQVRATYKRRAVAAAAAGGAAAAAWAGAAGGCCGAGQSRAGVDRGLHALTLTAQRMLQLQLPGPVRMGGGWRHLPAVAAAAAYAAAHVAVAVAAAGGAVAAALAAGTFA
eukprot:1161518-Pelagomonas_calceolata.AAC.2